MIRPMYFESGGFEAIHADWPAYPAGHGREIALSTLCFFPVGTHFEQVDEVDQCWLLRAKEYVNESTADDLYSLKHFHVALWREDVLYLRDEGWVDGFYSFETVEQYKSFILNEFINQLPDPLKKQNIEHFNKIPDSAWLEMTQESNEEGLIKSEGIRVSEDGWDQINQILVDKEISIALLNRIEPLARIAYYDSAIRDAAIILESTMRESIDSSNWGFRLIDEFYDVIKSKFGEWEALDLTYRSEIRALFRFTRNEFAHNLVYISEGRYRAVIYRLSRATDYIQHVANEIRST